MLIKQFAKTKHLARLANQMEESQREHIPRWLSSFAATRWAIEWPPVVARNGAQCCNGESPGE